MLPVVAVRCQWGATQPMYGKKSRIQQPLDDPMEADEQMPTSVSSTSHTKVARREVIRSEVEALVRRVVPDEIDNVDEMMTQSEAR